MPDVREPAGRAVPAPRLSLADSSAVGDLLAYGQQMATDSLIARDREQYQFWQGWNAALERVAALEAAGGRHTDETLTLSEVRQLIGFLSSAIPELHQVDVPRLADALDRFLAISRREVP